MTVADVTSAGRFVRRTHETGWLRLALDPPPKAGASRALEAKYGGVAADGLRIGANKYADSTFLNNDGPVESPRWPAAIDDRNAGGPWQQRPVRKAIPSFSEEVGPLPHEKRDGGQVGGFTGGMELANSPFNGQDDIDSFRTPSLVAHEIAHQQFGNSVTEPDRDDIWRSERFGSYFALPEGEHYDHCDAFVPGLWRSLRLAVRTRQATTARIGGTRGKRKCLDDGERAVRLKWPRPGVRAL